jgi:hypothetical protein
MPKRPDYCNGCVHFHSAGAKKGGNEKYNAWCCAHGRSAEKSVGWCKTHAKKQTANAGVKAAAEGSPATEGGEP